MLSYSFPLDAPMNPATSCLVLKLTIMMLKSYNFIKISLLCFA